jgi:hypothetical protein
LPRLIVGAPAVGGALFLIDKLIGDRVARFASVKYTVKGPWKEPKITFDKPFDALVAWPSPLRQLLQGMCDFHQERPCL